jgi:hypothetical protein
VPIQRGEDPVAGFVAGVGEFSPAEFVVGGVAFGGADRSGDVGCGRVLGVEQGAADLSSGLVGGRARRWRARRGRTPDRPGRSVLG